MCKKISRDLDYYKKLYQILRENKDLPIDFIKDSLTFSPNNTKELKPYVRRTKIDIKY